MLQKYIDKIFDQQITFLNVYQSWTEFVKIRWYNYNSLNSQVIKCHVLEIKKKIKILFEKIPLKYTSLCSNLSTSITVR